jgi:O-antigen ligase
MDATAIKTDTTDLERILRGVAFGAMLLMLFVAPFPASAGLRGALLLMAAVMLLIAWQKRRARLGNHPINVAEDMPPLSRTLLVVAALWAGSVGLFALLGPDPQTSLSGWRGDVLTPLLASVVFYVLIRRVTSVLACGAVLLAGLVVLVLLLGNDPFRPLEPDHAPLYGGVGRVSAWFVALVPLAMLAWFAPLRERRGVRVTSALAGIVLLIGAWLTENRMIWICYSVMLLTGALVALATSADARRSWRRWLMAFLLLLPIGVGFAVSIKARADLQLGPRDTPIEFLIKDVRGIIWRESLNMIAERPWRGHGYDLDSVGDAFVARMNDPRLKGWIRHPHNAFLHYALQIGVVGAAILLAVFVALFAEFVRLARHAARAARPFAHAAACCGAALVVGVFLRNMVDDFLSRHMVLLFGAVAGMLLGLAARQRETPLPSVPDFK